MGSKKIYLVALTLIFLFLTISSPGVLAKQDVFKGYLQNPDYNDSKALKIWDTGMMNETGVRSAIKSVYKGFGIVIIGNKEPVEEFADKHTKGSVRPCGASFAVDSHDLEKASIVWLYSLKDSTDPRVSHPALFDCFPFVEENRLVAGKIYKAKIGGVLRIMIVGNDSEHLINMVKTLGDDIFDVEEITGTEEPTIDENLEETTGIEEPSFDKNEKGTGAQKEAGTQAANILKPLKKSTHKLNYIIVGQTIILLFLVGLLTYQLRSRKKQ